MNNLKVSTRLTIGFGSILVLLLIVALIGIYGIFSLHGNLDAIAHVNNAELKYAKEMKSAVSNQGIAIGNIALLTEPADMAQESERLNKQKRLYADAEDALGKMFAAEAGTTDREHTLFAKIKDDAAAAAPLMAKALALSLANNPTEAIRVLIKEARPAQAIWLTHLTELADFEDQLNAEASADADAAYVTVRTATWCTVAVATIAGLFLAFVIKASILKQLGGEPTDAQEMARQIAEGNLTQKVHVGVNYETSLMASLEVMRGNLSQVVAGIKTSAESISVAAGEIAQGNVDLSQRTEEQAASLEETAASMEEITATVRQNTENARQGSTLANSASETAATGGEVVGRVVTTMQDISASSSKVVDIISVIEGIAFQTNILALNAAVEAARAGEQGRGFAVVAGEVRTLAQRSAAAAKEITGLIGTSVEHVNAGSALVHSAGETMNDVVRSVKRVTDIMGEIASASSEQSAGIEQVNMAVSQMDEVTQQNAALVEQATAAAKAMADQAQSLRDSVAIFRINLYGEADAGKSPVVQPRPIGGPLAAKKQANQIVRPKEPALSSATSPWENF